VYNLDHVLLGHQGPIYAMCLDQKYLYTASGDLSVARWDLEANEKDGFTILSKSPAISLETAYSQFLCIGFLNGDFQIIDLLKKEIVFTFLKENVPYNEDIRKWWKRHPVWC
jgi:hypothetical protein